MKKLFRECFTGEHALKTSRSARFGFTPAEDATHVAHCENKPSKDTNM